MQRANSRRCICMQSHGRQFIVEVNTGKFLYKKCAIQNICSKIHIINSNRFSCKLMATVIMQCSLLISYMLMASFFSQLHGVDDNVGKSKKILAAMSKRMDRNKWIIGGIIAALVLAILLILYFKLAY